MAGTPRLSLPFLSVGQAQKEFTHNEALQTLDILVAGAIEGPPLAAPPASPAVGACYIVDAAATDAWTGKSQSIAGWTSGGWRFVSPAEGMAVYDRSSGTWTTYRNGAWETGAIRGASVLINDEQVVGARASAIASPTGGTVVDTQGREAIEAILNALRQHGLIET